MTAAPLFLARAGGSDVEVARELRVDRVDFLLAVVVLGGPNGAGKSTAAPRLLRGSLRVEEFVNADTLAQGFTGVIVQLEAAADAKARGLGNAVDQHLARASELAREAFERALGRRSRHDRSDGVVYGAYDVDGIGRKPVSLDVRP